MDNLVEHIQRLEIDLKKAMVAERLLCNPDFISIFVDGYCKDHLIELVDKRAKTLSETENFNLGKRIDSIAFFRQYLQQLKSAKENILTDLRQANESLTQSNREQ